MLIESGVGGTEELAKAKRESEGLGLFVRSLVGLERAVAKEAFDRFPLRQDAEGESDRVYQYGHRASGGARLHGSQAPL